ncbi:uncharacterized protein LOC113279011 [Papaver somniferum]|uniref:uncharacterized protein LOC113279011 n=1 Tax=Papaver somniferum TaxID=3469 RepID=UPI000E701BBF|nr:uncharacterized protein LOC113279011 [Papaver somniferum]
MRHRSDSLAWKHIDHRFPALDLDSRNLRLGIAANGFNPFGDPSATHSCWPVMIAIYNLQPQACMQAENIILSMMIPGKKKPGLLMWTINDFPAYGNLSGCTYKGKAACPLCGDNTLSVWLPFSRKTVYMNRRRFLRDNHPFRQKKDMFNGEIERREKPPVMSGAEFKTKDGLNSRNDLKSMGIRPELHPEVINGKTILRAAPYSLSHKNKAILYNRMRNMKVPYGYISDLRKHFSKDGCLGVLKAHDYHVLMQQILHVALRGLLPEGPSKAIFRMHMDELKSFVGRSVTNEDQLISMQSETFADWFKKKVYMQMEQGMSLSNTVEWLSKGLLENCVSYKGLLINWSRFLTKDVQRVTQNNGVSIESKTLVAGRSETTGFYGVLEEILVLDYITLQVPIFKCDWAHTYFGVKVEKGFTLVNLKQHKNQFRNDPFILASQARQVFYSRESDISNWYVMIKPPPRGFHELEVYNENDDTSSQPVDTSTLGLQMGGESESYVREDTEFVVVVPRKKKNNRKKKKFTC